MAGTLDLLAQTGANWIAYHPYARIQTDGLVVAEDAPAEDAPADPLQAILWQLGEPRDLTQADAVAAEEARLRAAARKEAVAVWPGFSKMAQRTLLGLLVARLRYLQSELPTELRPPEPRLEGLVTQLGEQAKSLKVGFVFGLSAGHRPVTGAWLEDARRWWTSLSTTAQAR